MLAQNSESCQIVVEANVVMTVCMGMKYVGWQNKWGVLALDFPSYCWMSEHKTNCITALWM